MRSLDMELVESLPAVVAETVLCGLLAMCSLDTELVASLPAVVAEAVLCGARLSAARTAFSESEEE